MQIKSKKEFLLKFASLGIVFSFLLCILNISILKISLFNLHYFWHLTLISPFLNEKYEHEKFRYSFLKTLMRLHNLVLNIDTYQDKVRYEVLARLVGPLLFSIFLFLLHQDLTILAYGLLGSLSFELYFMSQRFYIQAKTYHKMK